MKKVNIRQLRTPDKSSIFTEQRKYSIYLGNNSRTLFSNEKYAKKFLTDVNQELNLILTDLNLTYIEIFQQWRRCWACLSVDLDKNFDYVNKCFRLSVKNTGDNANHFAFVNIYNICNELLTVSDALKDYYLYYKEFTSLNNIKTVIIRIENLILQLNNLGKKKPDQSDLVQSI